MKKNRFILIALLILIVGFASVSTTLYITGSLAVVTNQDDFDVYFSGAELDDVDVSNVVIKDKTHIEFTTNDLVSLNDTSTLMYEITNGSKQYDADISIECTPMKTNYYEVTLDPTDLTVVAGKVKQGKIEIKLIGVSSEEQNLTISCELKADAVERTETGDDVLETGDYSIAGYFVNEDGTPVSNANLVVYSDTPHYVTTDMYGYFYVENLERGLHEIYYLNTLSDPKEMTKEEIISSADGNVDVATNNIANIEFSNNYEIVDSLTSYTNDATYEVTFDTGDSPVEVTQNHRYGTLPSPIKKGYNFNGWYYKDKLINEDVIATEDDTHELVAKWIANTYTITFDANSGSVDTLTKEVTYDSKVGELPIPTREGYTFSGWYYGENKYTSDTVYEVDDNITLVAKWTPNTYTITYDGNGGSVSSSTKTVTFGENYGTLEIPTKTGYTFSGWYYGDTKITSDSIVSVADNITLTAKWTANTYTLTYNANGGSVSPTSKTVTYDSAYGDLPTPTRTGYTFSGWYNGSTKITSTSKCSTANDLTLTAKWTLNTYTITFKSASGGSWGNSSKSVSYGSSTTVTITPSSNYKLSSISCTNGYTISYSSGSTSSQTVTIYNNSKTSNSTCTPVFSSIGYTASTSYSYLTSPSTNITYTVRFVPVSSTVTYGSSTYYYVYVTSGYGAGGYDFTISYQIYNGSSYVYGSVRNTSVSFSAGSYAYVGTTTSYTVYGTPSIAGTSLQ